MLQSDARDDHVDARRAGAPATPTCSGPSSPSTACTSSTGTISRAEQRDEASTLFDTEISPVLTPLSLDAAHPFPYVSNLSTSWAFRLDDPVTRRVGARARQGAAGSCRSGCASAPESSSPERVYRRPRPGDRRERGQAVPGHGDRERAACSGSAATPRSSSTTTTREQARARRAGGPAAPLRAGRAARDPAERRSGDGRRAARAVRAHLRGRLRDERAARLHDAVRDRRARNRGAARPAVDAASPDRARGRPTATSSPRSAPATSCCTSRTTASTPASSGSSARRPTIR